MTLINNADDLVRVLSQAGFDTESFSIETYEFEDENGIATYFNATAIREYTEACADEFPIIAIGLSRELVEATRRKGLEGWKMDRLREWMMRHGMTQKMRPILICRCEDGTHICVDGAHRIAMFNELGARVVPGIILEPDQWRQFAFATPEALAENYLSKFSDNLDG